MIKRLCICLSLVLFLCTMSGCQGAQADTLDISVETHTVDDGKGQTEVESETTLESESSLYQTSQKTVAEMVQAPKKFIYDAEIQTPNNINWQMNFDADIVLPAVETMDVVAINFKGFTENDRNKLIELLFPENAKALDMSCLENFRQEMTLLKKECEEKIQWNLSEMTEVSKAHFEQANAELSALIWEYQFALDLIDASKSDVVDFACVSQENVHGDLITVYMSAVEFEEWICGLLVINDYVYYVRWLDSSAESLMKKFVLENVRNYYNDQSHVRTYYSWMIEDLDTGCPLTADEVNLEVTNLLSQMGVENYFLENISPIYYSNGTTNPGYEAQYVSDYEGVRVCGSSKSLSSANNSIQIAWETDYLAYMKMRPVIESKEIVSEDVELLPFSRIEEFLCSYLDGQKATEDFLKQIKRIHTIALEYVTVFDETTGQGMIVPAWNIYERAQTYQGANQGWGFTENITGDPTKTLLKESDQQIMSINAIDGSILYMCY